MKKMCHFKELNMMNIAKAKIDKKGRIQLPKHFMLANDIKEESEVIIQPIYNNKKECKLVF